LLVATATRGKSGLQWGKTPANGWPEQSEGKCNRE